MKLPTVPPINREEGRALQPDGPEYWTRRACGNEVLLGLEARNRRGDYDMFFSTTAKFHGLGYHKAATSFYDFKRSAHRAWQAVRWDHSEIAGFATYDEQLKCLVRYPLPNSKELGKKWADQTIVSEMSTRTAMEIRDELAAAPRVSKHREDGVVIYMIADVPNMKVPIGDTELRFLFHVNPLFLDGIGVPNTVGRFFYRLAYELTQEHDPIPTDVYIPGWEESMFYVLDGAKYLLHANQVISGPVYDDALKEHLKGVDRMMVSQIVTFPSITNNEICENVRQL